LTIWLCRASTLFAEEHELHFPPLLLCRILKVNKNLRQFTAFIDFLAKFAFDFSPYGVENPFYLRFSGLTNIKISENFNFMCDISWNIITFAFHKVLGRPILRMQALP